MTPCVSIITPFLNAEAYLAEAIDSVRRQTFADWELLLVDDSSTDGSAAIAQASAVRDCRIHFLPADPTRRGAAAARNRALALAKGEFVTFLDADDVFDPKKLAVHTAALRDHPEAAMLYGATLWWYPNGPRRNWRESMRRLAGRVHQPPSLLSRVILLSRDHCPCVCGALIRRSALDTVGGFDERFRLYEDQTLWVKLFLRYPVLVTDDCLAKYRQRSGSVCAEACVSGEYNSRAVFLEWVGEHIREVGVNNRALNRALRAAKVPYAQHFAINGGRLVWHLVQLERLLRRARSGAARKLRLRSLRPL